MRLMINLKKGGKDGLVPKKVTVNKNGKTFTQVFYVKVGDEVTSNTPHGEKRGKVNFVSDQGAMSLHYEHDGKGQATTVGAHSIKQVHRDPDEEKEAESEKPKEQIKAESVVDRAKQLAGKAKRIKLSVKDHEDAMKKLKQLHTEVASLVFSLENMHVGPNTQAKYENRYSQALDNYNNFRRELVDKHGMSTEELGPRPNKPMSKKGVEIPDVVGIIAGKKEEVKSVPKVQSNENKSETKDVIKPQPQTVKNTEASKKEVKAAPVKQTKSAPVSTADFSEKEKAMKAARESGITWTEHPDKNINWMRASMAIKKHSNPPKAKKDQLNDKIADYKSNPTPEKKGSIYRLAKELGDEATMKEYAAESKALDSAKKIAGEGSSLADHIKDGNKEGAMAEAKKLGIIWKEHDNVGVNWMRAAVAIKKYFQSKGDETSKKSLNDLMDLMKAWASNLKKGGKPGLVAKKVQVVKNGKTFTQTFWVDPKDEQSQPAVNHSELHSELQEHIKAGKKSEAMKMAKDNGISWKDHDHEGINWMRAHMAIKKHSELGQKPADDSQKKQSVSEKPKFKVVGHHGDYDIKVDEKGVYAEVNGKRIDGADLNAVKSGIDKVTDRKSSMDNVVQKQEPKAESKKDSTKPTVPTKPAEPTNKTGGLTKDNVMSVIPTSKTSEREAAMKRMTNVERAIARAKSSSTFNGDIDYSLKRGSKDDAKRQFEQVLRAHISGDKMTEKERDILGSGPYGMNYKYKELQTWEGEQWHKARQEAYKKIDDYKPESTSTPPKAAATSKAAGSDKLSESSKSKFNTAPVKEFSMTNQVFDYEHDGDLENEMRPWQAAGFKVEPHHSGWGEDRQASYTVSGYVNEIKVSDVLKRIESGIDRMWQGKGYDGVMPQDMLDMLNKVDKKNKTDYVKKYQPVLDQLADYYNKETKKPTLTVKQFSVAGNGGVPEMRIINKDETKKSMSNFDVITVLGLEYTKGKDVVKSILDGDDLNLK